MPKVKPPDDINARHWGHDLHFLVYFVQHCVVVVLYLIINAGVPSWTNWNYPYQSTFFPAHIMLLVFDYVKFKQWNHSENKVLLTSQQVWTDQIISFVALLVDIVLLVNQSVSMKHGTQNPAIIQLSLVVFVTVVDGIRWIISWCRKKLHAKGGLLSATVRS